MLCDHKSNLLLLAQQVRRPTLQGQSGLKQESKFSQICKRLQELMLVGSGQKGARKDELWHIYLVRAHMHDEQIAPLIAFITSKLMTQNRHAWSANRDIRVATHIQVIDLNFWTLSSLYFFFKGSYGSIRTTKWHFYRLMPFCVTLKTIINRGDENILNRQGPLGHLHPPPNFVEREQSIWLCTVCETRVFPNLKIITSHSLFLWLFHVEWRKAQLVDSSNFCSSCIWAPGWH